MKEYYPTPFEILSDLKEEAILVGSASKKHLLMCKDIDFVISTRGVEILSRYDYWLDIYDTHWKTWIPYEAEFSKCIDFFHGICDIEDKTKWPNRITYEQASLLPLKVTTVAHVEVLAING